MPCFTAMRAEIALMSGSAFAVTHHAFSSGAGRTSDGNGSHASTLKSPSYTKSVSWQHYRKSRPDWDVKLTDDLRFNGWLSMYKFANDLNTTGYADTRVETETGLQYTFNETVALRVNYYLERGFNMDDSRNNGEFSTQEIRAYLPLTLGNHSVTPYTRIGLDRWSNWDWQDDIEREGHDFNRVGLFYGYDFQNGLSVSLEYAFEWQDHDEGDSDKFHYAGVGVNYSF
ncbi:outer membrane protein G [Shigella flexneri VA-6]|nr:outer membrane protein G [Shigella flexneri VA-6]